MAPSVFYGNFFLVSREIKQTCIVFLPSAWPTRQTSFSKQRTSPSPRLPGRRRRRPGGDVPCLILRTSRSLSSAPPTRWVRPRHARRLLGKGRHFNYVYSSIYFIWFSCVNVSNVVIEMICTNCWKYLSSTTRLSFLRCVQAPEVQAADSPLTLVRRQLRTKRKWRSVCVWPEVPTSVTWFQLSRFPSCELAYWMNGLNSVPLVILTQWIYTFYFAIFFTEKVWRHITFPGKKFCFWRCL